MGTFRQSCTIENVLNPKRRVTIPEMLVDTGSDHTWVPGHALRKLGIDPVKKDLAFVMANGVTITRSAGFAIVRSGEFFTIDEVVFGEPGDQAILGARSLEGFNARVDPKRKQLVAAGPMPAAVAHRKRNRNDCKK